ncbi:MAG: anthranilate phosphoribosyltransferase [Pseudomonadota bacterium]
MADLKPFIAQLADGQHLTRQQATDAFSLLMSAEATPSQIGAFLMGLRVKGETSSEIAGAVSVMRDRMTRVRAPECAIDIVGTGGDGSGSYNVSTAAALVTAACGVPVAKHGNRAASSKSGTADTLAALGINLDAEPAVLERAIMEAGIGFLFAQKHHAAMRFVMPTRVEMGTRTIFNLLGPLSNPAGVTRQLLGVFAPQWVRPIADALAELGCQRAWVVHGSGLDEITTTGPTKVAEVRGSQVTEFEINPQDAGLPVARMADLKGGDPQHNAAALTALLNGEPSAYRDIVLMNAGAAMVISEKAENLADGVRVAAEAIDSGAAKTTLAKLVAVTNG